jgi:deoxyhypusine monooxygenase
MTCGSVEQWAAVLNGEASPIGRKMRSLFELKRVGGAEAVEAIASGALLTPGSVLLQHEAAYVLGQMQDARAVPVLVRTLENDSFDPVVRHECAEALAAIGAHDARPVLERFANDSIIEVAESCQLALGRLDWLKRQQQKVEGEAASSSMESHHYESVDPAPAEASVASVDELVAQLTDRNLPLFKRYRAMFALRNIGTESAVLGLTKGFDAQETSAVFRHEIAYVLGQVMHRAAVPALHAVLADEREHCMVRHEAAEALGAVQDDPSVIEILKAFVNDKEQIVAESCRVAIDIYDHWNGPEEA